MPALPHLLLCTMVASACAPRAATDRPDAPATPSPEAADHPSPEALTRALAAAVDARSSTAFDALCTPDFRSAGGHDSCRGMFEQLTRKGLELSLVQVLDHPATRAWRAVLVMDVLQRGRRVDQVNVYADLAGGAWRVDGIDESDAHAKAFLAGAVSGSFQPERLPESPDLHKLASEYLGLVQHLRDTGKDPQIVLGGTLSEAIAALTRLASPRLTRTWILVDWNVGALGYTDANGEILHIYVRHADRSWTPVGHGFGGLSSHALLRAGP